MLISKSLLAVPYGTVLTSFGDPLSSFGLANSFTTTLPSDTVGPRYGRMARVAGTAIAAGSVGYGAVRFAAFATRPRRVYIATVPFEYHGSTFNRTAAVYDAPLSVVGPKYSFAGAYEAALLTSLAVIDVDALPLCPAFKAQDRCLAGSKAGLIVDLLLHRPSEAAPVGDLAIEDAEIGNDETVSPIATPTSSVRGSPTRRLRPTTTNSHGYENKYEYKNLLTFIKHKYTLYALAFLVGLFLSALTILFLPNDSDEEEEDVTPSNLNPVTPLIAIDVAEVEEFQRKLDSGELVHTLIPTTPPFWETTQDCDEPRCSHDHSDESADDSDVESLEYEDIEVARALRARTNPEALPHLMIATVILPAIFVGLQTIVEEDVIVAENNVDEIENNTVVAQDDDEILVSKGVFYDAPNEVPIEEEQVNRENSRSFVVTDVVTETIQPEILNGPILEATEGTAGPSNESAHEVIETVQSEPLHDVSVDASLKASVVETLEAEPILQAIEEDIPTSRIEIADAVEREPLQLVKEDMSAASDLSTDVVAAFRVESSQQVAGDEETFNSTVDREPVQEVIEDVCAATDPDVTLVAVVQCEAFQEVAVEEKSFTSNGQPVEAHPKPDQILTQDDNASSPSDHPPQDEASSVCTSNPAIPPAAEEIPRKEVEQVGMKPIASNVPQTSAYNSYNRNAIAHNPYNRNVITQNSVPQAITIVPTTKPIKVFIGSSYRPPRNPRPRR